MKSLNLARLVVASPCLLLGAYVLAFQPAAGYHLLKKVSLGATEGGGEYFDYISFDAGARRVYLAHGTEVKVDPPAEATATDPHPRPRPKPGTFRLLIYGR